MTQPTADGAAKLHDAAERQPDVTVPWLLSVLLRDRRLIIAVAFVGFAFSTVIALRRPIQFTSSFSFIPQSGTDQSRAGLASIAGQLGISIGGLGGQPQPPQLYADLIKTREVLQQIARDTVIGPESTRIPLSEFLKVSGSDTAIVIEKTIRALQRQVVFASVASRTTGVVTVTARTQSAQVSYGIAQGLLDGLNQFNIATRKSQATEERRFTEGRLQAARTALRTAEDKLQAWLQANRQYGNAPELTFQQQRLERDVLLQQQVVTGLAQQYEDARIREVRDTPVITVIERPVIPVIPDPRGRLITVFLGTMVTGVLAVMFAVLREGWRRKRMQTPSDPSYAMLDAAWRGSRETSGSR